jgi:hypothetical protein
MNKVSLYTPNTSIVSIDFYFFDASNSQLVAQEEGTLSDGVWYSPELTLLPNGYYNVVAQNSDIVMGDELISWNGTDVTGYPQVIAKAIREEFADELAHLVSLQNGITDAQAIMLIEIYSYLGLDPTRPLVVNLVSKNILPGIEQTIDTNNDRTIITRINADTSPVSGEFRQNKDGSYRVTSDNQYREIKVE